MKNNLYITQKIKQRLLWLRNDIYYSFGKEFNYKIKPYDYRIMIYHGIDSIGNLKYNSRFISYKYFEQQISYFRSHFNIVTIEDIIHHNLSGDKLNIAISFDDGYANNLKYAVPILEKYAVPATIFISTIQEEGRNILWTDLLDLNTYLKKDPVEVDGIRYIKKGNDYISTESGNTLKLDCKLKDLTFKKKMEEAFNNSPNVSEHIDADYYQLLNPEEIRELSYYKNITLGTHGKYHNCLGMIDQTSAIKELKQSKDYLQNLIQEEITQIAYPDGSYTRDLIDAAEDSGYKYQLAVDYLFEDDKDDNRICNRFGINPYISWNNQIYSIFKGSYL